jgi:hypothetical protein
MFLSLALAIVVDRTWAWWSARDASAGGAGGHSRRRLAAGAAAIGVGIVALVSPALGSPIPFSTRPIAVPAVYRSPLLRNLPAGTILFGYPVPNGFFADPLVWQAEEYMPYNLVAGYGFIPSLSGPTPTGQLLPSPAYEVFQDAQVGILPPKPTPTEVAGVRADFRAWHVSVVVEYVGYGVIEQPTQLAAVVDAATGVRPQRVDGARVWRLPG